MPISIPIIENILNANDQIAADNLSSLNYYSVFAMNLIASPGAGKTSLIEQTVENLKNRLRIAVIDGDLASNLDADRAAAAGAVAIQINTGGQCHLDAAMIRSALKSINLSEIDLLIIENVGNLICPSAYKLGTHVNILIASIPEGDDKPYKYPGSYTGIDGLVINKIDLLPYVPFNIDRFRKGVDILNPDLTSFLVSCKTGEGMHSWYEWLLSMVRELKASR